MITLSILIATLTERQTSLKRLTDVLNPQLNEHTECLIFEDNRQLTIGRKRDILLRASSGSHVCFLDDDDLPASDYVQTLLNATQSHPDAIGFYMDNIVDGKVTRQKLELREQGDWAHGHLLPVKRELALQVGFKDLKVSEDIEYSKALLKLVHNLSFVDKTMYFRYFDSSTVEQKRAERLAQDGVRYDPRWKQELIDRGIITLDGQIRSNSDSSVHKLLQRQGAD